MMNKHTYYTPLGLVREKKREKRSRSKTVTERGNAITKTTSRSSEDDRTSSPSPTMTHSVASVDDLPALPDSVPPTPSTKPSEPEAADTPRAMPSAGSVSQYLQPSVEDDPEQATPRYEKAEVLSANDAVSPVLLPADSSPATVTEAVIEPSPIPDRASSPTKKDQSEAAKEPEAGIVAEVVTENEPGDEKPEAEKPNGEVTPADERTETADSKVSSKDVSSGPPDQSVDTSGATGFSHQHYHPAHGIPQGYPYPPSQIAYHGYPHPRDGHHSPVPFQQSPAFGPMVSYSPVPGFHPYPPIHPLSLVPAPHGPQYQQPPMEISQSPGLPARIDRNAAPSVPPVPTRDSDDALIQQLSVLLPDIVRVVTHHRPDRVNAEVKAVQAHYTRIIEEMRADATALKRENNKLKQKAEQADAFLVDNARLLSEKHAILQDLSVLKEERSLLAQSRDALLMTHAEHERAIADLKHMLQSQRENHDRSLKIAQLEASKQAKGLDDSTAKLRAEVATLTTERNNRIREVENIKSDYTVKTSRLEAKLRDLEDELDRTRRSARRDDHGSTHLERSASVSAAMSRDVGSGSTTSRNSSMAPPSSSYSSSSRGTTVVQPTGFSSSASTTTNNRDQSSRTTTTAPSAYENSTSGTTRDRSSNNDAAGLPAPIRRTTSSQAPSSHRNSISTQYFQNGNSGRGLPGGYDYYDDIEMARGERTMRGGDGREGRDSRDIRDSRDSRDTRDSRDSRDSRDTRDTRDSRDNRDGR